MGAIYDAWMSYFWETQGKQTPLMEGYAKAYEQMGEAPPAVPSADRSAKALLLSQLEELGLGGLGDWAWEQYKAGVSEEELFVLIKQRPEYKERFPAMEALNKAGKAITEAQYISYERSAFAALQRFGIPSGIFDNPETIAEALVNDVDAQEFADRVQMAAEAQFQAPPEVRQELIERYGVSDGALTAVYLDFDKAAPMLQQDRATAAVAGAAARAGVEWGSWDEAERYAREGATYDQALQRFQRVARAEALRNGYGERLTTAQQVGAEFGEADDRRTVDRVVRSRQAAFAGGGQYADTQNGVTALGSASR